MANLRGEYRHKLDAKGRLSLPSAFRKALPKDLVVTLSPEKDCLFAFASENFDAWVMSLFDNVGGFQPGNKEHAHARRLLNSRAKAVELDGSGRIGLSADQRASVDLDKEVVLVGDADHFEIWNAKRWDETAAQMDDDLSALFSFGD